MTDSMYILLIVLVCIWVWIMAKIVWNKVR